MGTKTDDPAAGAAATPHALSSPVCYAAEFDAAADAAVTADLVLRLNALLEAERAGAKVLGVIARTLPDEHTAAHALAGLQRDEADNAVLLFRAIRMLGGAASTRVGDFVEKTLAIEGLVPRLRFVNKGQAWVARKIDEALPLVANAALREMLVKMREDHLRNIAACDHLVLALEAG